MDWLDPEQWKKPAETIGYWQTIVGGSAAILGVIVAFLKWGLRPLRSVVSKIQFNRTQPLERPLRFVLIERQSLWSPAGKPDGQRGTMVNGAWHVTNISQRDFVLLRARLENYNAEHSHVVTEGTPDARLVAPTFDHKNPILAGQMSEVMAHFMYFPAICDGREPPVADVIFTDNYRRRAQNSVSPVPI